MKNFSPSDRRSITAINAAKLLQQHGTNVSLEQAHLILEFLYKFAKLSVKQIVERESNEIQPEKKTPRKLRLINKPSVKMKGEI